MKRFSVSTHYSYETLYSSHGFMLRNYIDQNDVVQFSKSAHFPKMANRCEVVFLLIH